MQVGHHCAAKEYARLRAGVVRDRVFSRVTASSGATSPRARSFRRSIRGISRAFDSADDGQHHRFSGQASFDLGAVHTVAEEFGWTVGIADDLCEAAAVHACRRTSAVLFHRDAFGPCSWLDAVRLLKSALPEVRPVVCHEFSESIDWPALCDAGAFHSLWLPLNENEVRRSFGFVWEADKRLAEAADRVPMSVPAPKRSMRQRIQPAHGVRTAVMTSAAD